MWLILCWLTFQFNSSVYHQILPFIKVTAYKIFNTYKLLLCQTCTYIHTNTFIWMCADTTTTTCLYSLFIFAFNPKKNKLSSSIRNRIFFPFSFFLACFLNVLVKNCGKTSLRRKLVSVEIFHYLKIVFIASEYI